MISDKPFLEVSSVGKIYRKLYLEIIDEDESCIEILTSYKIGYWIVQQPKHEWNFVECKDGTNMIIKRYVITKELYMMLLLQFN